MGDFIGRPKNTTFKCARCGFKYPVEDKIVFNKKNYCPKCGEPLKVEGEYHKKICTYVYDMIMKNQGECNMSFVTATFEQLKNKYEISYAQTYYILRYMYEFAETPAKEMETERDVYRILNYFSESKQFWREYKRVNTTENKDNALKALQLPVETIVVKRSDLIAMEERDKKENIIPIIEFSQEEIEEMLREEGEIE